MEEVGYSVAGSQVYARWHPARGRRVALLVHGFNSSLPEFGTLPAALAEGGVNALAIDLRGHGLSRGEAGRIDLDRAIQDIDAAVEWIRSRVSRPRIACVGHSLGAALVLGVAARRSHFDALVLAHPVHRLIDEVPLWQKPLYHLIGRRATKRATRGHAPGHIPRDPRYRHGYVDRQAARQAASEGYVQRRVNLGNYTFALTMDAAAWASKVQVPALCIHSAVDRTVEPAASQRVFDALQGPTEHLVHKGGHSCFRDLDGERVVAGIVEFVQRRLGGA